MTANLLARILLRVFGIYLAFEVLATIYQLVAYSWVAPGEVWGQENPAAQSLYALLLVSSIALYGSSAAACLVHTGWLARKLFPDCGDQEVSFGGPGSGGLLFRLLAVGFLLYAIPGLLQGALEILWYLGAERRHLLTSVLMENGAQHLFWLVTVLLAGLVYRHAERLARAGS